MAILNRQLQLASRPEGVATAENFEMVTRELDPIRDGEFLVRNVWMSVDPYMRGRMNSGASYVQAFQPGEPLEGACVGRIVESRNQRFREGDWVLGNLGWREWWTSRGEAVVKVDPALAPPQSYLGVLGMTGMTAWVGMMRIADLKPGNTVFVSAASGAVGSIVCQIAKLNQCRVIGSAGSAKKLQWLRDNAHIDGVINYKDVDDLSSALGSAAPDGIDIYFDNVGGEHLEASLDHMNDFGCVVACGMISMYNTTEPPRAPRNLFKIITRRLRVQGFIVLDHLKERDAFLNDMGTWIRNKQIFWEETVTEGLENAPRAFLGLFQGENLGKSLVRIG